MNQSPDQLAGGALNPVSQQVSRAPKLPQVIRNNIFAFPPNRDTFGGTAYLIVRNEGNILIDCPAWTDTYQQFLQSIGGVQWLFITHREAIGKAPAIQKYFDCHLLIQEQEAYLLPKLPLTTFRQEYTLTPTTQVIWTPGHSPGSSCLYDDSIGGVLFSGRHLLPNAHGKPIPLRTPKTFHWRRQINSVELLLARFTPETLQYICPGANTGLLRGEKLIENAYNCIAAIDLSAMLP